MLIAHAPSGYIVAALALRKLRAMPVSSGAVICACVSGALAPDLDLFYFYLVDHHQTHHHRYFSHWPILWLGLTVLCWMMYSRKKESLFAFLALLFSVAGFLHMVLDSFVGDIWWFAPFVDKPYALFSVPARFKPWWLSFILHWSFAAELVICSWAWALYRRRSQTVGWDEAQRNPSIRRSSDM
jgi:inner membrane protein